MIIDRKIFKKSDIRKYLKIWRLKFFKKFDVRKIFNKFNFEKLFWRFRVLGIFLN